MLVTVGYNFWSVSFMQYLKYTSPQKIARHLQAVDPSIGSDFSSSSQLWPFWCLYSWYFFASACVFARVEASDPLLCAKDWRLNLPGVSNPYDPSFTHMPVGIVYQRLKSEMKIGSLQSANRRCSPKLRNATRHKIGNLESSTGIKYSILVGDSDIDEIVWYRKTLHCLYHCQSSETLSLHLFSS